MTQALQIIAVLVMTAPPARSVPPADATVGSIDLNSATRRGLAG